MRKVVRDWEFAESVKLEQRRVAVLPDMEVLAVGEQYFNGDVTKIYNNVEFVSCYHDIENYVIQLTKEEFCGLSVSEQVKYINELSNFYSKGDFVELYDNAVIDLDTNEKIENIFDYLLDLHINSTDLQNKCFSNDAVELIGTIITDNISNIDEYDTVPEFLDSIKLSLEDGEFISTLDSNEDTINIAYSMLENKKYKLDKGTILYYFVDKSGLKKGSVYEILGMNNSTFIRKIENNFNFSHAELVKIKEVLNLSDEDFLKLF